MCFQNILLFENLFHVKIRKFFGVFFISSQAEAVISEVKKHSSLPVFIGSGITAQNAIEFRDADGFIVGSFFKQGGRWQEPLEPDTIQNFMHQILSL